MDAGHVNDARTANCFGGWLNAQSTPAVVTDAQSRIVDQKLITDLLPTVKSSEQCCSDLVNKSILELLADLPEISSEGLLSLRDLSVANSGSTCTVGIADNIYLDVTMTPQFHEQDIIARLWVFQDQTIRHQAIQHQEHSLKMKAITRFAAGMAHEFNNLLTAILGNLELLRARGNQPVSDPEPSSHIENAEVAALRASQLIYELRKFASRNAPFTKVQSLIPIIKRVRKILAGISSQRITVTHEFRNENELYADVDSENLEDALLKFGLNAIDAIGSREGSVTFVASINEKPNPEKPLKIRIIDDGDSSESSHPDATFEPFAANRRSQQSTGLGMAMGYRLVEEMNGHTELNSNSNGNELVVSLPISDSELATTRDDSGIYTSQRGLRVAVIESDSSIRRVSRGMLSLLGHKTETYDDGDEFIRSIQDGQSFDLIILSNVVQGMPGRRTYQTLRTIDRETPVVICSGQSVSMESFCPDTDVQPDGFLSKPFSMTDLSAILAVYT